ncbi:MAG: ArdC-like ssDNA-binding domain-containing protein, partial [Eubacteriales bacterium]
MGKLQDTQNLYEEYRQKVTGKPDTWKGFLTTMSNNHKYDFDTQLLIYAQRPEATACATFDVWSKQVKRRINRGSKGIPIIVYNQWGTAKIDHLYDITSTTQQKDSMPIKLWNVQPQLEPFITEKLAEKHDTTVSNDLGQMIMDICADISLEHCENTVDDLAMIRDNSFLEDLDELN